MILPQHFIKRKARTNLREKKKKKKHRKKEIFLIRASQEPKNTLLETLLPSTDTAQKKISIVLHTIKHFNK